MAFIPNRSNSSRIKAGKTNLRQSIGTVGQQDLESPMFRQVAHPVQGRTIQPRPAVSLVGKLLHNFHAVLGGISPQGF
jgi:hypothetical protein